MGNANISGSRRLLLQVTLGTRDGAAGGRRHGCRLQRRTADRHLGGQDLGHRGDGVEGYGGTKEDLYGMKAKSDEERATQAGECHMRDKGGKRRRQGSTKERRSSMTTS